MDPNATLRELLQSWLLRNNIGEAFTHAENLQSWLWNGGFNPLSPNGRLTEIICDALTCDSEFGNRVYACSLREMRKRLRLLLSVSALEDGVILIIGDVEDFIDSVLL